MISLGFFLGRLKYLQKPRPSYVLHGTDGVQDKHFLRVIEQVKRPL